MLYPVVVLLLKNLGVHCSLPKDKGVAPTARQGWGRGGRAEAYPPLEGTVLWVMIPLDQSDDTFALYLYVS